MQRTIDTEPLIELLKSQNYCFHSLQEIDESSILPKEIYIDRLAKKSYSTLVG